MRAAEMRRTRRAGCCLRRVMRRSPARRRICCRTRVCWRACFPITLCRGTSRLVRSALPLLVIPTLTHLFRPPRQLHHPSALHLPAPLPHHRPHRPLRWMRELILGTLYHGQSRGRPSTSGDLDEHDGPGAEGQRRRCGDADSGWEEGWDGPWGEGRVEGEGDDEGRGADSESRRRQCDRPQYHAIRHEHPCQHRRRCASPARTLDASSQPAREQPHELRRVVG
ncbi:hypothetical protein K523DRAFT_122933 [Schizophyllum commune Tattone D]|nr:hypothetical protein K523DRAFT_122933 [Schizophyllum commune Tattone D]